VVRVAEPLKIVAMIVDDRMLHGAVPRHSLPRPGENARQRFAQISLLWRTSMVSTRKPCF
jgi:hypothetical protein